MAGCRPLSPLEIKRVSRILDKPRDKLLFVMGVRTGFRIQELLSLSVKDVQLFEGQIVERLTVRKKNMKEAYGRSVALHNEVRAMLKEYVVGMDPDAPLFWSQKGGTLSRFGAYKIIKDAFDALGLEGQTGTHSMRKTFARAMYEKLGKDILKTSKALGHHPGYGYNNTERYLEIGQDEIDDAITED